MSKEQKPVPQVPWSRRSPKTGDSHGSRRESITPASIRAERRAVRRGTFLFWFLIVAGALVAIWIATR